MEGKTFESYNQYNKNGSDLASIMYIAGLIILSLFIINMIFPQAILSHIVLFALTFSCFYIRLLFSKGNKSL